MVGSKKVRAVERADDVVRSDELQASTGYLLAWVGAESRRRWSRMLLDRDLTPHHFGVLMSLEQLGAASQQQLSRLVGVDPRNAVPLIDLLEERGLIARAPDPEDRRRYAVSLTTTGRSTLTELRHAADEVEVEMLKHLDPAERRCLHDALTKLFTELIQAD